MRTTGHSASMTVSLASGASFTEAVNLSRSWGHVHALVPSLSTNSAIEVFAAKTKDGDYSRVMAHSAPASADAWAIPSGTTGWVRLPQGFPWIKFHMTDAVANGAEITVFAFD